MVAKQKWWVVPWLASMQQVMCDLLLARQVQGEIINPRSLRLWALSRVLLVAAPMFWRCVQPQVHFACTMMKWPKCPSNTEQTVSTCHSPAQSTFFSKIRNQHFMWPRLHGRRSKEVGFLCYITSFCAPHRKNQFIATLDKVGLLKFLLTFMVNFLVILMACGSSMGGTRI